MDAGLIASSDLRLRTQLPDQCGSVAIVFEYVDQLVGVDKQHQGSPRGSLIESVVRDFTPALPRTAAGSRCRCLGTKLLAVRFDAEL